MPQSSAICAMRMPFLCASIPAGARLQRHRHRHRARPRPAKCRATNASSLSSAEPASRLQTFFAGHPMLMSMISAPASTLRRAASAIIVGSKPAICTTRGLGFAAMIHAPARFRRVPEASIRGEHLRGGEPRAETGGTACETAGPSLPPSARARRWSATRKVRFAACTLMASPGAHQPASQHPPRRKFFGRRRAGTRRSRTLRHPCRGPEMSSVASARSPGASMRTIGLADVFRGLEVARADVRAEAIGQRHAQQRIGLQLRRRVEDARPHAQRAGGIRISGDAPLAQLIGGEIRRRLHLDAERRVQTLQRPAQRRVRGEPRAVFVDHLCEEHERQHGGRAAPCELHRRACRLARLLE